jgi:hypothetical protein
VLCAIAVTPALRAESPAKPKAKVEFRWLAAKPVKGVTDEKGLRWGEGPELLYPHLKPVVTNADVAGAVLKELDLSGNGLGVQYQVEIRLSGAARKKLSGEAGDRPSMLLAAFIDGQYWGTMHFQKAEAANFTPFVGFFASKAEAERVVEAFK